MASIWHFFIFAINKNVVQVYNNKNVKLFYQNLVDIALKSGWCISQTKKHYYLILKIAIISLESCFLFVSFSNLHSIINIGEIK